MSEEFKPRHKEFFECDCYSKDHLIRAEYDIDDWTAKDGETHTFRELSIIFTCNLADYDNVYRNDNKFMQFIDRWKWRIKNSWKILRTGEITTEGYFSPCRTWVSTKENPIESQFGYETTKNLAKFLNDTADKIKTEYENDWKVYQEKIKNKKSE